MTELVPSSGFSRYPARGESNNSPERIELATRRVGFALGGWALLIGIAFWKTKNPLVLVAGALIAWGLVQSERFSCSNNSEWTTTVVWMAGWALLTWVGRDSSQPHWLWLGFLLVTLGVVLMTVGRCGSPAVDYLGRILFAAGVLLHQLAFDAPAR